MRPDRHPAATEGSSGQPLASLRASWPPRPVAAERGYRPLDLTASALLDAFFLDDGRAVAVIARPSGNPTALACRHDREGWRVAVAGDGVAAALVAGLGSARVRTTDAFELLAHGEVPAVGPEREPGTDQSNASVVLGDSAIVKWRTDDRADGVRAQTLRRHLQANAFGRAPALLGSLSWSDVVGQTWALADVDAYLPDARDGWDDAISGLLTAALDGCGHVLEAGSLPASFGTLTAELHAALARPSEVVAHTGRVGGTDDLQAIRAAAHAILERTLRIDAADQAEVIARSTSLRAAIRRSPTHRTPLSLIHGDLHVGQLVRWRAGLDVIDFDGPPEPTQPAGPHGPCARDVAQAICSLWSLAAVVDRRTEHRQAARLAQWAGHAEVAFLSAYRRTAAGLGSALLDERLLEPFIAEQFCRELLYAEARLPRWRYAPLRALRWRYPVEPGP